MSKPNISLTKNELEIMELMWSENRPLARSEIIEFSPNRSWKASSIHILLNKMIEKGAVVVEGFIKTNKNYGRTFSPAFTKNEYYIGQIKENALVKNSEKHALVTICAALLQEEDVDNAVLTELEQLIAEKRKTLAGE